MSKISIDQGSRLHQAHRETGGPEFAVHSHAPFNQRVPASSGARDSPCHDGETEKRESTNI